MTFVNNSFSPIHFKFFAQPHKWYEKGWLGLQERILGFSLIFIFVNCQEGINYFYQQLLLFDFFEQRYVLFERECFILLELLISSAAF